ncbi:hypothetical protein F5141DRAFT_1205365 [Pisolithus sp. B1]|nr:hypothetical protein F5141DRAFT_1205365 [Pisolithus sp. B1]
MALSGLTKVLFIEACISLTASMPRSSIGICARQNSSSSHVPAKRFWSFHAFQIRVVNMPFPTRSACYESRAPPSVPSYTAPLPNGGCGYRNMRTCPTLGRRVSKVVRSCRGRQMCNIFLSSLLTSRSIVS